jgi:trehalose-phosphatase
MVQALQAEAAVLIEREWRDEDALPTNKSHKLSAKRRQRPSGAKPLLRDIPRILARLREAQRTAVLLDCDGTLVPLKRHPSDVHVPTQVKEVLARLVRNPRLFVAIVSGRRVRDLKALLDIKGLHYFGLHGAEWGGGNARVAPTTLAALRDAKQAARRSLHQWPGIWIEDKGLTFSVHYRQAKKAAVKLASLALAKLLKPWGDAFHVLNGSQIWEVLPREVAGKSSAVLRILQDLPEGTPAIYMGDDGTDELAFEALEGHITVRVGDHRSTRAHYYVRTPSDAVRFLARLERGLR